MGKIFDALEKANAGEQIPISAKKISEPIKRREPLIPFDRLLKGTDLAYTDRKIDENIITYSAPDSMEAEQFKMLRTNILFPVSGKTPRTILVTSATPGEGKSFVSSNLAVSIARNINEHVLLIDCDLRKPCIHQRFGYGRAQGLSEYLNHKVDLPDIMLKTGIEKLSILPGGSIPDNPSELLSSDNMAKLLVEVKERYEDRIIILDSPPPRLTAETNVIARQVDGILLVVQCGATNRDLVAGITEKLGKDKILGVVFNWFDAQSSSYYGYGYGYGK